MQKADIPYNMSFSTGTLFREPSILIAKLYAELEDWNSVRAKVLDNNQLQARTNNTAKRVCREIISRLKGLTPDQMSILTEGFPKDQGYILWAAVCKRYRLIYDFAVEVVHEKFLTMDLQLTYGDYDVFLNKKAEWHAEIVRIKASTRNKLRQVVFKMLRDCDLLTKGLMIIPIILSPAMRQCIQDDPDLTLAIFPVEDRKA